MGDRPYIVGGLAMVWGFFHSFLRRDERLADPAVVSFVRRTQWGKLKGLLAGKPIHET
jgi:hypothetical protein